MEDEEKRSVTRAHISQQAIRNILGRSLMSRAHKGASSKNKYNEIDSQETVVVYQKAFWGLPQQVTCFIVLRTILRVKIPNNL